MATLWSNATIPVTDATQPGGITTGTWMFSDVEIWITSYRFYRGQPFDSGPHHAMIFDQSGTILAQRDFVSEASGIGWREQPLATPLHILANTPFCTALFSTIGSYEATSHVFDTQLDNAPLHGYASASGPGPGGGNGVFDTSGVAAFPTGSFNNTGYFVDVVYQTTEPNDAPVAEAGPTQHVAAQVEVTLDGSGSTDDDGTVAGYVWRQISGPAVTLSSTIVVNPTFSAPNGAHSSLLLFGLIVTDNRGASSAEDNVVIVVDAAETARYQLESGALQGMKQYRLISGTLTSPDA